MAINERGEYLRKNDAPDTSGNSERDELIRKATELTARQDQEPETEAMPDAEKKAAMKRRILGE